MWFDFIPMQWHSFKKNIYLFMFFIYKTIQNSIGEQQIGKENKIYINK